jgi:dihydroorotate dehydrogenase
MSRSPGRLTERIGVALLRRIEPEAAHRLALAALGLGLVPLPGPVTSARLRTRLAGLDLPNPVGMAAGFDKNAVAVGKLIRVGFGFVEAGATTPLPQPGGVRPRVYRLPEDGAVINRFGFNNEGAERVAARLARRPKGVPVGLNLGANRDSADRPADFAEVLTRCGPYLDFAVVNVSSPNTAGLRDLQGGAALSSLLRRVMTARAALPRPIPIFLKIAPDLTHDGLAEVVETALAARVDALVCTNTTIARDNLKNAHGSEPGGLSGKPLFERSTRILARAAQLSAGQMPLIGVGGIASAEDAYIKIRAGASAVQLYTALAFQGFSLAARIAEGLDALLARDGFANVADAVGTGRSDWL